MSWLKVYIQSDSCCLKDIINPLQPIAEKCQYFNQNKQFINNITDH